MPGLANPFFSQILSGIASALAPAGYNLLVADTRSAGADTLLSYAEPSRADGLIVLDGTLPAAGLTRMPVVLACEWVPGLMAPRVKIDNREAAAMAVITPGVFQVVAMIVRSNPATHCAGAATIPTRKPVATFLDKPLTYTVLSGAISASGGGAFSARKA